MKPLAVCLFIAALTAGVLAQTAQAPQRDPSQKPPTGGGVIAGAIVQADSGRPGRRATVTLTGGDPTRTVTTIADEQGHFTFAALPPGAYTLSASKSGWLDTTYGQKRPGNGRPGTPIQLAAGQKLEKIALSMPRGGVITGTVLDEVGEPAFGVSVRLMKVVYRGGARTLAWSSTARTDDRGIYRIAALLPGEYLVLAQPLDSTPVIEQRVVAMGAADAPRLVEWRTLANEPAPGATEGPKDGTPAVYYLNTTNGKAATNLIVDIGEEKTGIDLQLQRVPMGRLSGSIVNPDGVQMLDLMVQLIDHQQANPGASLKSTPVRGGQFSFSALPPGNYTLWSMGIVRGGPVMHTVEHPVETPVGRGAGPAPAPVTPYYAMADVTLTGQPVDGVVLTLQKPTSLSGQVVFDGPNPPVDLTKVALRASRADLESTPMEVPAITPVALDAQGRFTLQGLLPGRYRLSGPAASGFAMTSAMLGGVDTLDIPLTVKPGEDVTGVAVTYSRDTTELSGSLQDANGGPAPEYTVIVFSTDERFWLPNARRVSAVRPGTDGRFKFAGLPPGDYRLAAVTDIEPGQWFDPAFLKPLLAASVQVSLAGGEKKEQTLRVR
jgi:uncharacterized protein (DUF2141 family)